MRKRGTLGALPAPLPARRSYWGSVLGVLRVAYQWAANRPRGDEAAKHQAAIMKLAMLFCGAV
eukprot:10916629-Alexandrium_andersonii.AAC.1